MIEIKQLTKSYGSGHAASDALRGLDLTVKAGEFVAVQGASGSGKTTLLNLLAGFDVPDSGRISIMDRDVGTMTSDERTNFRRTHVGFVFQTLNLLPTLTAAENIALQSTLAGKTPPEAFEEAANLLDRAGLGDRVDAFPEELSGGEQQRVAVLRSMIHHPKLLLLDEPTSCLDTENTHRLLDLIETMNTAQKTTILIATHDTRVAEKAGRIATICDGIIKS